MEVIGYDPFLPADRWDPEVGRRETMEEIFAGSDIVSIHMPSTPETRNSVDRRLIGMMKPTAYLINAARGDLIREADLAGGPAERRHCRRGAGRVPNRTPQPGRSALPAAQRDGHAPQRGSDAGDHGPHGPPRRYGHRRSALRPPAFLARGGAQGAENMMRFQR